MIIKPNNKSITSMFGIFISVISFLFLIRNFVSESSVADKEIIYLFIVMVIGSFIISWLSRFFVKLYLTDEYVGYSSLFKENKIKFSEISNIQYNTIRHMSKGIVIVSRKFKKEGLLDVNSNYSVNIEIESDFNNRELGELLKLILSKNEKIEIDDHIKILINGGNVSKSHMEYLLANPYIFIPYIFNIVVLALLAFYN